MIGRGPIRLLAYAGLRLVVMGRAHVPIGCRDFLISWIAGSSLDEELKVHARSWENLYQQTIPSAVDGA